MDYVHTSYGVLDVLTDGAIYMVKGELSTPNAHSAIGRLMTDRIAAAKRRLVIACCRATASLRVLQAIKELGIEIVAIDTTLTMGE